MLKHSSSRVPVGATISRGDILQLALQPGSQNAVDLTALLPREGCQNASQVVDHLVKACFVQPLNDEQCKKLCQTLGELPPPQEWPQQRDAIKAKLEGLLTLMVSTPQYQIN